MPRSTSAREPGHTIRGVAVEKVRLKIGNMAKAVLVTGQAYQDPRTH